MSKEEGTLLEEINTIFQNREQIVKEKELETLKAELENISKYSFALPLSFIVAHPGTAEGKDRKVITMIDQESPIKADDQLMPQVDEEGEGEGDVNHSVTDQKDNEEKGPAEKSKVEEDKEEKSEGNEKEVRLVEDGGDDAAEDENTPKDQNPSEEPQLQVLQSDDPQNDDQAMLDGNPASKNINEESMDSL